MSANTDLVIGIDVGTTSMKAHAFSLDGTIIGRAQQPTLWQVGHNGQAEIDILVEDFRSLAQALRD